MFPFLSPLPLSLLPVCASPLPLSDSTCQYFLNQLPQAFTATITQTHTSTCVCHVYSHVLLRCISFCSHCDAFTHTHTHTGPHAEAFSKICKHFVTHGCRLGTKCRFLHCTPSELAEKLSTQKESPSQPNLSSQPQDNSASNTNSSNNISSELDNELADNRS